MAFQDLSSFNNSWYNHGRSTPIRLLWMLVNGLIFQNPLFPFPGPKPRLLRMFGAKVGVGVMIKPQVSIKQPWFLEIGDHVWIGEQSWIDNLGMVRIGNHVCISQGAMLLTGNHNYKKTTFDLMVGEIHLKEGSWVGARAVVCPGVTLGEGAILSVGSIATKSLSEPAVYQGNPAQKLRMR